ncbi:MAG TPA: Rieske 2Fe-2S domain-containing protein [Chitinophagaceae bacterium]
MERKDFLSMLGMGTTGLVLGCLSGCSKGQGVSSSAPTNVDFTLDLTQAPNAALKNNGGFIYNSGLIIARTLAGQYIAVSQTCTHQNYSVGYIAASHEFYCSAHGGTYAENGQVFGGPPPRSLTSYNTSLNGNMLRIYS